MQAVVAQTLRALMTCSGESFTEFGSNNVRSATQWRQCVDNTIQYNGGHVKLQKRRIPLQKRFMMVSVALPLELRSRFVGELLIRCAPCPYVFVSRMLFRAQEPAIGFRRHALLQFDVQSFRLRSKYTLRVETVEIEQFHGADKDLPARVEC